MSTSKCPIPNVHSKKEIPNFQGIVMSRLRLIRPGIRIILIEIRLGINRFESFMISFKIFAGTYLRADDNVENNQMYCYRGGILPNDPYMLQG